jgi:hypothetical protein
MTAPRDSDVDFQPRLPIPAALRGSAIQCDHTERMLGIVLWIGLVLVMLWVSH